MKYIWGSMKSRRGIYLGIHGEPEGSHEIYEGTHVIYKRIHEIYKGNL